MNKKSRTSLEYVVLFLVVVAAVMIGQNYLKRAYQGRVKASSDSVGGGELYSPGHTTSSIINEVRLTTETVNKDGITTTKVSPQKGFNWTNQITRKEKIDSLNQEEYPIYPEQ